MLDAAGSLILSSDNSFDFHAEIWSLLVYFWNINRLIEILNDFVCHYLQNSKYLYRGNNLNQTLEVLLFYLALLLILFCSYCSVPTVVFKSEFFTRLEI